MEGNSKMHLIPVLVLDSFPPLSSERVHSLRNKHINRLMRAFKIVGDFNDSSMFALIDRKNIYHK